MLIFCLLSDEATKKLRNALYTACKVGNAETLGQLLAPCLLTNQQASASVPVSISQKDAECQGTATIEATVSTESANVKEATDDSHVSAPSCEVERIVKVLQQPFGDHGSALLHVAATGGHKAVIGLLLEAGADPAVK